MRLGGAISVDESIVVSIGRVVRILLTWVMNLFIGVKPWVNFSRGCLDFMNVLGFLLN